MTSLPARKRHGWIVGALLGLGVALLAAALLNAAPGKGDAATATATEAAPGTVPQFDLNVDIAVEGPLGEVAEIEVIPDEYPMTAAIGYPVENFMNVVIKTTGDQDAELPTLGPDVDSWTGEDDGWTVSLSPPRPVQVVAGGPSDVIGQVVAAHEVPAWLPRLLHLGLESTDLLTDTSARRLTIPLGDSAVRLTVTFTPSTRPQAKTLTPVAADGAALAVPPVGQASADALPDGTPIWIANTDAFGVTVVDGRAPFRPEGIVQLTRWCPSAEGFYELYGGSRFTGDGTYAFGPAPGGLATYEIEPAGEGQVRIVAGQAGAARPPPQVWPPPTDGEGYPLPDAAAAGPFCNDGPDEPDGEGLPADDYPPATVAELAGATGRFQFEGRLVVDQRGRGQLCTSADDPLGCSGPSVPVDLSAFTVPRPGVDEVLRAYDAPVVVTVGDGVVSEVWMDGFFSPNYGSNGAQTSRMITRVQDIRLGADARDCAEYAPDTPCAGVLDLEQLAIYDRHGPISSGPPDNALPNDWVVVDAYFRDADIGSTRRLHNDGPLADGTPIADIPRDELVVLTQTGDVVTGINRLQVAD